MKNQNPNVSLREITKDTLREFTRLRVRRDQQQFVATNAESVAQAYFSRDIAWFRGIYVGDSPAGFVMLVDDPANQNYYLWRLMVDARFQGQGVGRHALELVFEYVRSRPGAKALLTSIVPGEGNPGPFYQKMGFSFTGDEDEGELVLRREL